MQIPEEVKLAAKENSKQNPFSSNVPFSHAEDAFWKLIKRKKVDYCSDDASIAVKTIERYYKGFLEIAMRETGYRPPYDPIKQKYLTESSHNLKRLRQEIYQNFPDVFEAETRQDLIRMESKLKRFTEYYTSASYDEFVPFETFREIIEFCAKEREQIQIFLQEKSFSPEPQEEEHWK